MCNPTLFELQTALKADLHLNSDLSPPGEGLPIDQFAYLHLLTSVGKKWVADDCASTLKTRQTAARAAFDESNLRCYFQNAFMRDVPFDRSIGLWAILEEARSFISSTLTWVDEDGVSREDVPPRDLFVRLGFGPGSSNGTSGSSYFEKLDGPGAATSEDIVRLYKLAIQATPLLYEAEENVRRNDRPDEVPRWHAAELARVLHHGEWILVKGSRATYVPKSSKTERLIASEPVVNMMFQLALGDLLADALAKRGIHIPTQQRRNKQLARRGSLTNDLATIDLQSASDSVGIELVKFLFPEDWFHWFSVSRSPEIDFGGGDTVRLQMIGTMGNGYTFGLETLVFLSIVHAVYRLNGRRWSTRVDSLHPIGIYGDDIICDADLYQQVTEALERIGFLINHEKSFSQGVFRESCGGDYYRGTDVRGVYVQRLKTVSERCSFANRLFRWGAKHGCAFPAVTKLLELNHNIVPKVPPSEQDDAGLRIPFSLVRYYPIIERRFVSSTMLATMRIRPTDERLFVYERLVQRSPMLVVIKSNGKPKKRFREKPDLLLMAILRGALRGSYVNLRQLKPAYERLVCVNPGWDQLAPGDEFPNSLRDYSRWETCVAESLLTRAAHS